MPSLRLRLGKQHAVQNPLIPHPAHKSSFTTLVKVYRVGRVALVATETNIGGRAISMKSPPRWREMMVELPLNQIRIRATDAQKCRARGGRASGKPTPKYQKQALKPTFRWSGRRDLNPRQPAPKAGALPDCATPRKVNQAEAGPEAPSAFLCISYSAMRREISPVTSFFVASTPTRIAW